ncbi:MAG: ANTAR domain-containing protein [Clostridiales bacterium]|jgi:response regulator NasT|nr:ANTAR domain-containing protein [Clostridiales bacterium]
MERALIVSAGEKSVRQLSELVTSRRSSVSVLAATDGSSARRLIAEHDVEVVIVNTPLPDENAVSFAAELAERNAAGILLLVKNDLAEEVSSRVEARGVFVIEKPIQKAFFLRALSLANASAGRLRGNRLETVRLQDKISELQLVNRAKCALIQYLRLTEAQAHRYIEKQAMDCRITKREVALGILHTYEP